MKPETLRGLLTARILFERAEELCTTEDRYLVSAGIVILQDALELVLYSALLELGVDEKRSIENLSFPELMGALKSEGHRVAKSGTLKALNQQRLTVKHYAQLAEPSAVRNYLSAAKLAIDTVLVAVVQKRLDEIILDELLEPGEAQAHISDALQALKDQRYFDALVSVRKAIFLAIEEEYAFDLWREADRSDPRLQWVGAFHRRGSKAPWYVKSKQYVDEHVDDPFDFVQINHERLTLDLMEWGVRTHDFWNIWRLTPKVFRFEKSEDWLVKGEPANYSNATKKNAQYCIDRSISILANQQSHRRAARWLERDYARPFRIRLQREQPLYKKASLSAETDQVLSAGATYIATAILDGLDGTRFFQIGDVGKEMKVLTFGYVPESVCEVVEEAQEGGAV